MSNYLSSRKFRLFVAFLSLLFLMNMIQESYAKYISSASATGLFTVAEWAFKVNDQDVLTNGDFSNTITPVIDANQHIKAGVIAPTSTGHFDLDIDYSEVGVSFDETITFSHPNDTSVTDLVFTGYSTDGGETIQTFSGGTNQITLTHILGEESTEDNITVYVQWVDGTEDETMDNASDTQASVNGTAAVKVDINFIQKAATATP